MANERRLIDVDELKRRMIAFATGTNANYLVIENIVMMINQADTVDAVEVVRCKGCINGEIDDPDFPNQFYCRAGCGWNEANFFCSYGERKEG